MAKRRASKPAALKSRGGRHGSQRHADKVDAAAGRAGCGDCRKNRKHGGCNRRSRSRDMGVCAGDGYSRNRGSDARDDNARSVGDSLEVVAGGGAEASRLHQRRLGSSGCVARPLPGDGAAVQRSEPSIVAIESIVRRIAGTCDMAVDAGCRPAFVASVVDAVDQELNELIGLRNSLAGSLGWPARLCSAVACSSSLSKETAATDRGRMNRKAPASQG